MLVAQEGDAVYVEEQNMQQKPGSSREQYSHVFTQEKFH